MARRGKPGAVDGERRNGRDVHGYGVYNQGEAVLQLFGEQSAGNLAVPVV